MSDQLQRDESNADESSNESTDDVATNDAEVDAQSNENAAPNKLRLRDPSMVSSARDLLATIDPLTYHRTLASLVRSGHHSVLQELPYSPQLAFHDPTQVAIHPEPSSIETVELYARTAYPDFDKVLLAAFSDPKNNHLLTEIYHTVVTHRKNVAIVTNHGQIIDIALVLAAFVSAMLHPERRFGVLDDQMTLEDLTDRCNVLVSRMVVTRQAFSIPAIQVLQSASRIFLTVPQTASRRRARLDPEHVRANNTVARYELGQRLDEGGQILLMAASGSQDLNIPNLMHKARAAWRQRKGDDPGEAPTLHLQPLYDGTINMMMDSEYVLPIAICLDSETPACEIGSLTYMREREDCHAVMDWIAEAHQSATGVSTIYHSHEDDLLTQVRAFLNRS